MGILSSLVKCGEALTSSGGPRLDQGVHGYGELELMEGERVDRTISTASREGNSSRGREESLLLTNSRIIYKSGAGDGTEVLMAAVDDIDLVEFVVIKEGYGAFVWAGLSVILSVALFGILENEIARAIVPVMVLGMGIYLIVNRLFFSGGTAAVFHAGASVITWAFQSDDESQEVRDFIEGLYRMKAARRPVTGWPFAPR